MNQKRSKKNAKKKVSRTFRAQKQSRITKELPEFGKYVIGKTWASIPFMDKIEDIVSLETQNEPIVIETKPRKAVKFISSVLKSTGIEPLTEIGDVIIGKR